MRRTKAITAILTIFLFSLCFVSAESGTPNFWRGNVLIDNASAPSGTRVDSLKGGVIQDTCFVGVDCIETNPSLLMYEVGAVGVKGDSISFKVWGVDIEEGPQTHTGSMDVLYLNISMKTLANGLSCQYNGACTSGICLHNVCRPTNPYCGDGYTDSPEECDGGGGCSSSCTLIRSGGGGGCSMNYTCQDWTLCSIQGKQTRLCYDQLRCGSNRTEERSCTYTPQLPSEGEGAQGQEGEEGTGAGGEGVKGTATGGNQTQGTQGNRLTGQVIGLLTSPPFWMTALALLIVLALIFGGYYWYKRK